MAEFSPPISSITLNINGLNSPKAEICQMDKNKTKHITQLYAIYKRLTLDAKTQLG